MTDRIKKLAEKYSSVIMGAREYFHANPGIEFQEFETTKKIIEILISLAFLLRWVLL